MEVGRLRSETQAWRVGEEGGRRGPSGMMGDQGLGWEPIYVTGRRQGPMERAGTMERARLAGSKGSKPPCGYSKLWRCPGVGPSPWEVEHRCLDEGGGNP